MASYDPRTRSPRSRRERRGGQLSAVEAILASRQQTKRDGTVRPVLSRTARQQGALRLLPGLVPRVLLISDPPCLPCHVSAKRVSVPVPGGPAADHTGATGDFCPEAPTGRLLEIKLPHPSQPSVAVAFLSSDSNLFEVHHFSREMGTTSALLRNPEYILADGSVISAVPFDPLFVMLSLLHCHASESFVRLSDVLSQPRYSPEVRRNLAWLASLPQVSRRIPLIADWVSVHKGQGSIPSCVQLGDFCRLSLDKVIVFLQRKLNKIVETIASHRLPFRECVTNSGARQLSPRSGQASRLARGLGLLHEKRTEHPHASQNTLARCEVDMSAAGQLAEEILGGYVPRPLLARLKQGAAPPVKEQPPTKSDFGDISVSSGPGAALPSSAVRSGEARQNTPAGEAERAELSIHGATELPTHGTSSRSCGAYAVGDGVDKQCVEKDRTRPLPDMGETEVVGQANAESAALAAAELALPSDGNRALFPSIAPSSLQIASEKEEATGPCRKRLKIAKSMGRSHAHEQRDSDYENFDTNSPVGAATPPEARPTKALTECVGRGEASGAMQKTLPGGVRTCVPRASAPVLGAGGITVPLRLKNTDSATSSAKQRRPKLTQAAISSFFKKS
ncbi:ydr279p family (rnase h2 complex component) protein [Cystoisospora suis]|uniref:Ydr279p family (Rnase h2 complex component) protein n=1 Tax=Cystoisospora suis TaxID=483139 RepID=A0A2C6KPN1_9APIC|nr:ydr279p family (rnase h2 complex component) protein [Cystoisospora suis]